MIPAIAETALSRAMSATDLHPELRRLCDESGIEEQVRLFLCAKGIRHVSTIANLCKEIADYETVIISPIIEGVLIGTTNFKAKEIPEVTRATLQTLVEEARSSRAAASSPTRTLNPPSTSPVSTDSDKPPKSLGKNVWQNRIKEWETSYTPQRKFPSVVLIGAEPILARMIWEHENKCYNLLQLGEIIQARSFTSTGEINKLATKEKDKCLEVSADFTLSAKKAKIFEPNSVISLLDALQAAKWAFVFCGYASEEDADKFIAFFEKQTKTYHNMTDRVRELWNQCYWRLAQEMRMSVAFAKAAEDITSDLGWIRDQLSRRPEIQSEHVGQRKGKGKGQGRPSGQPWRAQHVSKGKGKPGGKGHKGKGKGKGKSQNKAAR